jgi:hypothetical protein
LPSLEKSTHQEFKEIARMNKRILIAAASTLLIFVSGCGGGGPIETVIPAANAQSAPPATRAAPPDMAYVKNLIASNPVGHEGGALGRTATAEGSSERVTAQAFAPFGWSYHYPSFCSAASVGGLTYIYMSFTDGTYIYSADVNYVSLLSAACVGSSLVAVYITANYGSFALWSNLTVYR